MKLFDQNEDRVAEVFGEAILAPVRRLSNRVLKHYLFRQYNSTAAVSMETQVCHALEQHKLISVSYPKKEHRVWTDICQILFCQAFLRGGFDQLKITKPSAVDKCWEKLGTYKVQQFFKEQWRFLEKREERNTTDIARQRRVNLLFRLFSKYRFALYAKEHPRMDDKKHKSYSHYSELLSPENLIIKESVLKLSPSDLQKMASDPNPNRILLNAIVQDLTRDPNGNLNELIDWINTGMGGSEELRFDGRSLVHHFYIVKNKRLYIRITRAVLKDETGLDFRFLSGFTEPLTYYLSLLQCVEESSIIKLMEDLLSDFAYPPDYYSENMKNVDLNPWRWGMPDIVAYDNENNFHILLECKGPNDRLSKRHIRWLSRNLEKYRLNVGLIVVSEKQIGHL
jgi:hypothetical protein